jgi:uncharacterized protein YdbL (DUF1318 family)
MKLSLLLLLSFILALPALAAAQAPSPDVLRKRMEANLPKIDALKKAGKVGENNQGYLEARESLSADDKALIKVENADRKAVYELLSERAKASLEQTERTRAELIRKRSAAGVWLQDAAGKWYQK